MFTRITAFFMALINALCFLFGTRSVIKPVDNFRVTSYVIANSIQNPDALHEKDFDIITDVILFGAADFNAQGEVILQTDILEAALDNLRAVIKDKDINISLNILGPKYVSQNKGHNDDMRLQTIEFNKAFNSGVLEKNIAEVINKYNFDGVHFDYEHPKSYIEAWIPFNRFLVSLDKAMPDKTIGIAVTHWNAKCSIEAVDYIEVMLYDIFDDEGKHSTYKTATELIHQVSLRGIPLDKINFGLPFYARPTDTDAYWYSYNNYYDKLDDNNYFYDKDLDKSFWFNTPEVIADKTEYAINNGFGGVMIWHYACDLPSDNPNSLLKSIGDTVNKYY